MLCEVIELTERGVWFVNDYSYTESEDGRAEDVSSVGYEISDIEVAYIHNALELHYSVAFEGAEDCATSTSLVIPLSAKDLEAESLICKYIMDDVKSKFAV